MSGAAPIILLRTDASVKIGTGHVRRCLALADALRNIGAEALFVTRTLGVDSVGMIERAGHEVLALPEPDGEAPSPDGPPHAGWAEVPWEQDAHETIAVAAGRRVEVVLVDHYGFDARWHEAVAAGLRARIAAIDDLADRPMAVALLIDHNLSADPYAKHAATLGDARLLAGPRFALINATYAQAPRYAFSPEVRSIGMFLGGTDTLGLSLPIATALRRAGFAGPIAVATTSANPRVSTIAAARAELGAEPVIDEPDLAGFFAGHDLQIGAAGGAAWERCCIGVPTLTLCVAENQRHVLDPLRDRGAIAVYEGPLEANAIAAAALALAADAGKRRALSEKMRTLVDGRGAERAALALAALALRLRPATFDDARLMHEWRNDEAVRGVSRQSAPIDFEAHLGWLRASLARDDRWLRVALAARRPVGVLRFDRLADGSIEVSIYLDPQLQGLGLGPLVLAAGEAEVARRISAPRLLHAETLPGNRPSRRLFERAGYEFDGEFFRKRVDPVGIGMHVRDW